MISDIGNIKNLVDKFYCSAKRIYNYWRVSEPFKKIIRETTFTSILQSLVSYGNSHILESFHIGLVIEDNPAKEDESRS